MLDGLEGDVDEFFFVADVAEPIQVTLECALSALTVTEGGPDAQLLDDGGARGGVENERLQDQYLSCVQAGQGYLLSCVGEFGLLLQLTNKEGIILQPFE